MLQRLVRDFSFIHTGISVLGNAAFVLGSIFFFKAFESYYTLAVWLFVIGSSGIFVGALGEFAKRVYEALEKRRG
ncbi:YrhK family protein [Fulvimarina sp. MAC3]|uniref:YrhK family protein n=1 Tax=Fulvimarina sp. MAC3 TaxID=3148887 RepID=UPI0031FD279C